MSKQSQTFKYQSPIGELGLSYSDKQFVGLAFVVSDDARSDLPSWTKQTTTFLQQYFSGHRPSPLHFNLIGTPFQVKVWQALCTIPYGETRTYGELAEQLSSAPRAVGQAVKRNPFPIYIPCHRVVAKSGIGGFDGHSEGRLIQVKHWLLNFESSK